MAWMRPESDSPWVHSVNKNSTLCCFLAVEGGAMFCEHAKLRAGVAKFSSDDEKIFVTTRLDFSRASCITCLINFSLVPKKAGKRCSGP